MTPPPVSEESLMQNVLASIRNRLAIHLQCIISKYGPLDNDTGDSVKKALAGTDYLELVALGVNLEQRFPL